MRGRERKRERARERVERERERERERESERECGNMREEGGVIELVLRDIERKRENMNVLIPPTKRNK